MPLVDLLSFNYEKIDSIYQINVKFKSNTGCDIAISTNGNIVSGSLQIDGLGTGETIIETGNLSNLNINLYDKYNNMHVGEYLCEGHAESINFGFI
jgi:hypothetical protein